MAEENNKKEKKKGGAIKAILFLMIFFILIPGAAVFGFYMLNETFQYRVNAAFSDAPVIGSYFDALPTRAEKDAQIRSIAEYYLEISADRAVDKLILIKGEDTGNYNDIIRVMMQIDPNVTRAVLEKIRDKELKGDAISSTLEEINSERESDLQADADELVSIPLSSVREEMYKVINDGLNGHSKLARILEKMEPTKAYEMLSLLDDVDATQVLDAMEIQSRDAIRQERNTETSTNQKLISMSEIYASKDASELIDTLGNTSTYNVEELSVIFKELGVIKTGQILAAVEDTTLVNNIITQMKNNEVLESGEDLITKDILKTLKIYQNFDDNILQLTNIYSTMQSEEVANILKNLITNGALPKNYVLDNGDIITISDEMLAYEVLKHFDDTKIAEIIGYFEDSLASEVSKKLAVPEY